MYRAGVKGINLEEPLYDLRSVLLGLLPQKLFLKMHKKKLGIPGKAETQGDGKEACV